MSGKEIVLSCSVFKGIEISALEKIEAISDLITAERGEQIFAEGEQATHLYVVGSGSIRLCISILILQSEQEILMEAKQPGELIGWSALFPPYELTMSARADEKCQLLKIPGQELRMLCEQDEHLGFAVMSRMASIISSRLRLMERMFAKELELNAPSI